MSTHTVYDFEAQQIGGQAVPLAQFRGKPLLIVNTASACGFTPQYRGLEALQQSYAPRGFAVLGFPCNQFGAQEPGNAEQIATFCERNYAITFPMFEKIDVNGRDEHPLYKWLKSQKTGLLGPSIKWNFTKFLIDRSGKVVSRFAPTDRPEALKRDIEALL